MPRITGIFVYPVKSLRGYSMPAAEIDELGFVGDRRFLVIDDTGKFITQRTVPRMAQIEATLSATHLILSRPGAAKLQISRAPDSAAKLRTVCVWKSEGLLAEDCGDDASRWLSDFLGLKCHLVRIGPQFARPVIKPSALSGDTVSFADAFPFLIISEASLANLNERIQENQGEPVPMNRFRPSIVVNDCAAFSEDTWTRIQIGAVVFRNGGLCARCIMTTTDQCTGERMGREPLRTLAAFRRDLQNPAEVNFGTNLIHETKHGTLRVGDELVLH